MEFLYVLPALTDLQIAEFLAAGGEVYFGPDPYLGPIEVWRDSAGEVA